MSNLRISLETFAEAGVSLESADIVSVPSWTGDGAGEEARRRVETMTDPGRLSLQVEVVVKGGWRWWRECPAAAAEATCEAVEMEGGERVARDTEAASKMDLYAHLALSVIVWKNLRCEQRAARMGPTGGRWEVEAEEAAVQQQSWR